MRDAASAQPVTRTSGPTMASLAGSSIQPIMGSVALAGGVVIDPIIA